MARPGAPDVVGPPRTSERRAPSPRRFARVLPGRREPALLAGAWLASRLVYWSLGVSFDTRPLEQAYQFLHVDLLEHDLWTSVWHLHSQPPLFNVFLGVFLRLPFDAGIVFGVVYRLLGLALALLMYALAVRLGAPRRLALVSVAVFTVAPAAVLWEHYLFYTLPIAVLLCAAGVCLLRYLDTRATRWGAAFFASVTAVAYMRATYHLVWVLGAVALVAWAVRGRVPPRALVLAALPVVLVPALYVKNLAMFGTFSASSWMGLNLARVSTMQADPAEIERMIADGVLSERARINAFEDLDTFGVDHEPTGVAALDRRWRGDPAVGDPNLNNLDYVDISAGYQRDALAYIRRHPGDYARNVGAAVRLYFLPTSFYTFTRFNRAEIDGVSRAAWKIVDLQPRAFDDLWVFLQPRQRAASWSQLAWSSIAAYALVVVAWPVRLWRTRRGRSGGLADPAVRRTMVFVAATVAFAFAASVTLDLGENNRFRFETDPLVWAAATALVGTWWTARRRPA